MTGPEERLDPSTDSATLGACFGQTGNQCCMAKDESIKFPAGPVSRRAGWAGGPP